SQPGSELPGQPGFSNAGGAKHREQMAAALAYSSRVGLAQLRQLVLAPHQRSVQPAREGRRIRQHLDETVRAQKLRLALGADGLEALGGDGVPEKRVCLLAARALAWLRGLLRGGGDVDGIAGDERLAGSGDAPAGVDADPSLELEGGDDLSQLDGRP